MQSLRLNTSSTKENICRAITESKNPEEGHAEKSLARSEASRGASRQQTIVTFLFVLAYQYLDISGDLLSI